MYAGLIITQHCFLILLNNFSGFFRPGLTFRYILGSNQCIYSVDTVK